MRARLLLAPDCEITLEANPGTFETDRFRAFRAAGVTRLSIGVQSFNDRHLQALGRVHNRAQALAAVAEAAQAFDTYNLDLMYALPGQTLAELEEDLQTALALAPPHLSIYHLTIEPNTYFAKFPPAIPEDDMAYTMLDQITARAEAAGLARYEVSALRAARPPLLAQHSTTGSLATTWALARARTASSALRTGWCGKCAFASRGCTWTTHWRGMPWRRTKTCKRAELPFEYMLNALRLRDGFALQDFAGPHRLARQRDCAGCWPRPRQRPVGARTAAGAAQRQRV